jgi:hypothetical protein
MKLLLLFLASFAVALAGDIKLPSGRVLKNATMGPMMSTKPTFPQTLALKYETSVDFKSRKAISEEVEEVWQSFRVDADNGKYAAAVIMVVGPAVGYPPFVSQSEQKNFVFEKKDGAWKMLPYPWEKGEKSRTSR